MFDIFWEVWVIRNSVLEEKLKVPEVQSWEANFAKKKTDPLYLRNPLFDFQIFLHGLSLDILLKDSQVWLNSGTKFF